MIIICSGVCLIESETSIKRRRDFEVIVISVRNENSRIIYTEGT